MAKSPKTDKTNKPPRDAKGRLLPGHGGLPGAGRPRRQTETEYLDRLRENVTLDDWDQIINAVKRKAKQGDVRAFEALCKWCMPKQAQETEVERDDTDPEGLA